MINLNAFLLFISFVLNIIALLAIVLLYMRQNRLIQVEKKQGKMLEEMEDVISTYLLEMKEENEIFIKKVEKIYKSGQSQKTENINIDRANKNNVMNEYKHDDETVDQDQQTSSVEYKDEYSPKVLPSLNRLNATKAYSQGFSNNINIKEESEKEATNLQKVQDNLDEKGTEHDTDKVEKDPFIRQVLFLKRKGLSDEQIAKALGKGKTEIELLLKFRQNT